MKPTDKLVCPHCFYVHQDWWEYVEPKVDGKDSFKLWCESCGEASDCEVILIPHFRTKKRSSV